MNTINAQQQKTTLTDMLEIGPYFLVKPAILTNVGIGFILISLLEIIRREMREFLLFDETPQTSLAHTCVIN